MHVDDIYNAAINGNKELLIQLLEAEEIDINELIDCGMVDGCNVKIPLLRSVLHHMNSNGINYEILDILVEYGIDLDGIMIVKSEAFTRKVPVLAFVIREYKSIEIVKYLLEKGANPNVKQIEEFADRHVESYPMLYFAAFFCSTTAFLDLLLKYGANPNEHIITYSQQYACTQLLPPLFYAINKQNKNEAFEALWVDAESKAKLLSLLNYGANVNIIVDTGFGYPQQFEFYSYVRRFYTEYFYTLDKAIKERSSQRYRSVHVDRNQFLKKSRNQTKVEKTDSAPIDINEHQTNLKKNSTGTFTQAENKIRKLTRDLVNFDINNSDTYIENQNSRKATKTTPWLFIIAALAMGYAAFIYFTANSGYEVTAVIPAGFATILLAIYFSFVIYRHVSAAKARKTADQIRQQHEKYINELNNADNSPPEIKRNRWWNTYNGLTSKKYLYGQLLVWGPFERLTEVGESIQLNSLCYSQESFTGQGIMNLITHYSVLYKKDINVDEKYKLAELCFWKIKDGTVVSRYSEGLSESQIKKEMDEYNQQLDDKERFWNGLDGRYMTDEERYMYTNDVSVWSYMDSSTSREIKTDEYERKLRQQIETHVELSRVNIFFQIFRPVGLVVFDSKENVAAVLLYKEAKMCEHFDVDINKIIFKAKKYESSCDRETDRLAIIRNLRNYMFEELDPLAEKPSDLSDSEWAELMYSSYAEKTSETLLEQIRSKYSFVQYSKAYTIKNAR